MSTDRIETSTKGLESERRQIADGLASEYGIDACRVYFINSRNLTEPWLPPEILLKIARDSTNFKAVHDNVDQYIERLNQIVHSATVIDEQGRSFTRPGVATIGEHTPAGDIDEHTLAGGRAISAALSAAGFNPLKSGAKKTDKSLRSYKSLITLSDNKEKISEAAQRTKDLGRIHALGKEAELITGTAGMGNLDRTKYQDWLQENFGVSSVIEMDGLTRASVINALEQLINTQTL